MRERLRALSDDALGSALREAGIRLDVPTIDLTDAVLAGIRSATVVELERRPRTVRRAVLVAVAAVVLLGGAAVAGRLGVPGLRIVFGHSTHAAVQNPLLRGPRTTLERARGQLSFHALTPHGQGVGPAQVYARHEAPGGEITLAYPPSHRLPRSRFTQAGLLVTEFRGELDGGFLKKIIQSGTHIDTPFVNGNEAIWFSGSPHELAFVDRYGIPLEPVRLAGNALVWNVGKVTLRLECNCPESTALAIARSMR